MNGAVDGVLVLNMVGERVDDDDVIGRGRSRGCGRGRGCRRGRGRGAGRGVVPPITNSDPPNLVAEAEVVVMDEEKSQRARARAFALDLPMPE